MKKHKNDIYEDDQSVEGNASPPIAAATVLLLREKKELEVLMLQKTTKIEFGGMWVFPGGKVDQTDIAKTTDENEAARLAAIRETKEEAGLELPGENFIWFSHWVPPASQKKRFSTWFFLSYDTLGQKVSIDEGEIQNYQWITPDLALQEHKLGTIDLAPPTWVSLYQLSKFSTIDQAITRLSSKKPRFYQTKIVKDGQGRRVALWDGDAGYVQSKGNSEGPTHRLIMSAEGFEFEHSAIDY
ncbi:MAG: NUDIX hydrolase [Gammaproteobacteria bacterium]|nr:NUDIX hydrolase [Gammaproteobacteria bacterium]